MVNALGSVPWAACPNHRADDPQAEGSHRQRLGERCARAKAQRHADHQKADGVVRGVSEKIQRVGLGDADPAARPAPISARNMTALMVSTALKHAPIRLVVAMAIKVERWE